MIKRINLIEKKAYIFTYQTLVQVGLVVILINLAFILFQMFMLSRHTAKLAVLNQEVSELELVRDELMKKPVKKRISVGAYQELFDRIEAVPSWAKLMASMSDELPNTLWITSFATSSQTLASNAPADKDDKKGKGSRDKKAQSDDQPVEASPAVHAYSLEISGIGLAMSDITQFAAGLAHSDLFKSLVLSNSIKQNYGYTYTIKAEVNSSVR